MSNIKVTIPNLDELRAKLDKAPVKVASELDSAIKKSAVAIMGQAKVELGGQHGGWDTGRLVNSITVAYGRLNAQIYPTVDYAIYVHEGTRPHWAPLEALAPWARRHGIEPFLVQRAIAQKGTKANPFLQRAVDGAQQTVFDLFAKAVANIVNL